MTAAWVGRLPDHTARASRWVRRFAVGAAAVVLVGCASYAVTPQATSVADGRSERWLPDPRYRYPHEEVPFDNHIVGRGATSAYSERALTIPSFGDNGQKGHEIRGRYFRSELDGPRPLVIVLPIYARFTYPSRRMAKFLQRKSEGAVHVLDVEGKNFLFDWVRLAETDDEDEFIELFRTGIERERVTVIDIRRLIDWAEQRPEIDADRVALVGFSRSAILAAMTASQESRLAATVLMMGGAHPHQIIARCDGVRTSAVQENVLLHFGWDQDELERRLYDLFSEVDSADYPGRVDPAKVLIFEAANDECIPSSSREALRDAMGRPKTYSLDARHRTAFIGITPLGNNWLCRRTWDFLRDRFGLGDRAN